VLSAIDELLNPICLDSTPNIVQGGGDFVYFIDFLWDFMGFYGIFYQVNKLR
jgi:hypothetical protein